MTVQSVIREVTAFVGVRPPQGSVFLSPYVDRTAWEFVQLANEIAQRIAYDTRDWTLLRELCKSFIGAEFVDPEDGLTKLRPSFALPANYQRMLLTAQVWKSSNTNAPVTFVSDPDEWLQKEMQNASVSPMGEWTIFGGEMHFRPALAVGEIAKFYYLRNNPVKLNSGGYGSQFLNDADTFPISERLLKLAMIWQWKCNKGATYAEDLATYEDALAKVAGADKPSPIIVGHMPISSDANIAYWGPTPPGSTFVGPGI
jgi:hypothetical protein